MKVGLIGNKYFASVVAMTLILLMNTTFSYAWIIYHKPAFKGRVIDAETKEPIKGAVVVAVYYEGIFGFAEGITRFLDIQETLTKSNGEFYIPSYTTLTLNPLSIGSDFEINIIFKPGYGSYPQYNEFGIWALPEGLAFTHKISDDFKNQFEDTRKKDCEEFLKSLPDERRKRTECGDPSIDDFVPVLPMKDAKKRLQALNIPYYTLPADIDIKSIKWVRWWRENIFGMADPIDLEEDSYYMVIGLPKLKTMEERAMSLPYITIHEISCEKLKSLRFYNVFKNEALEIGLENISHPCKKE